MKKLQTHLLLVLIAIITLSSGSMNNSSNGTKKYSVDLLGHIGKSPIFMRMEINELDNGDVKYKGYYAYNNVAKKIILEGYWQMRPGTPTKIHLKEFVNKKNTGEFELMPTSYGDYTTLEGYWYGNEKMLDVKLRSIQ